ncbi:MAG TPA: lactate dehydrogenase [Chloroflexota bacterium]|nr:lactate dehydrogenase [Chloroflexota bacterium]
MDLSIVGAAGEVARSLATQLLLRDLIGASDRLQFIGLGLEGAERKVLAERVDLLDAFNETAPRIDVSGIPDDVAGDIVVMAAGATVSGRMRTRRDLAMANRPVFETFASALARNGTGREVVVVVTNPVELGVEIFSRYLERHRVLGMGAQQDSLRFARTIAQDAGVRRDRIHAWVLGEHGEAQVPLWSSVRILEGHVEVGERVARLRGPRSAENFPSELDDLRGRVFELLASERIQEAFDTVEASPPDLRAAIEPFITAHCLHSTPNATANATCDVIHALRSGRDSVVGAQVRLEGEFFDLRTTFGVPVLVNAGGWSQVVGPTLADDEVQHLAMAAAAVEANLTQWTSQNSP